MLILYLLVGLKRTWSKIVTSCVSDCVVTGKTIYVWLCYSIPGGVFARDVVVSIRYLLSYSSSLIN